MLKLWYVSVNMEKAKYIVLDGTITGHNISMSMVIHVFSNFRRHLPFSQSKNLFEKLRLPIIIAIRDGTVFPHV